MLKKRLLILAACVAWLAAALPGVGAVAASDTTYTTPEDAITAFFAGVTEGDFGKILQACAVDEIAQDFRFDRSIERLRAFVPPQEYAPAQYPLFVELNKSQVESRIASQVKLFAYSLLSSGDVKLDGVTAPMDVDAAVAFMNAVDPSRLSSLEVKGIGIPSPDIVNSARYQENAVKMAAVYGADDSTERVVLFSFEGSDYLLGFTLLRYGESWKIVSASSPIAGTTALGTATKISAEDFAAMTK